MHLTLCQTKKLKHMKYLAFISLAILALASSCVGDDFIEDRVDPILRITNPLQSLVQDTTVQLEISFKNNIGIEEEIDVEWMSDNSAIADISTTGILSSIEKGATTISARVNYEGQTLEDLFPLEVSEKTVVVEEVTERTGSLKPSSFYDLEGDFTLEESDGKLILTFNSDYDADTGLPGLYIYLTNNPNSVNGAKTIGKVQTFSGAHTYEIEDADLFDYSHVLYFCKPFNVKVGDGKLSQ